MTCNVESETLGDPSKRREYDQRGTSSFDRGESFERQNSRNFSHGFSDQRAFDIFNSFFSDIDDFHNMAFGGFGGISRNNSNNSSGVGRNRGDPFGRSPFGSLFNDDFLTSDPFSNFGGGGFSSSSSMSFSSSSMSGSGRGVSRSTSTSSYIGPDGRRITRKETTITHSDGRRESNVEEFIEDAPINRISAGNNFGDAIIRQNSTSSNRSSRASGGISRTTSRY